MGGCLGSGTHGGCDTQAVPSDSGSRILMGVAGWIIAAVGYWGFLHNDGQVVRLSGGASWMSPGARRFWAVVVLLFGVSLIVGSLAL